MRAFSGRRGGGGWSGRSWGWRRRPPRAGLLAGRGGGGGEGVRRRRGRGGAGRGAEPAGRRPGADSVGPGLLAGGGRRRALRLWRRRLPGRALTAQAESVRVEEVE